MQYRRKPVLVDVVLWDGSNLEEVQALGSDRPISVSGTSLLIETLEGTMTASIGDYVIKGIQGELHPCKPDIFAATYEPTEAN